MPTTASRSPARARACRSTDERLARRGRGRPGPAPRASTCSTCGRVPARHRDRRVRCRGCTPACGWCCRTDAHLEQATPGLEAATRQGKRPGRPRPPARGRRAAGRPRPRSRSASWCSAQALHRRLRAVLAGAARRGRAGGAVAAGRRGAAGALGRQHRPDRPRPGGRRRRRASASWTRGSAAGVGCCSLGARAVRRADRQSGQLGVARDVVVAGVLGVGGLALMVGPWLFRLRRRPVRGAGRPGAARRSAPTWPRTCTTRCSRRWR